MHRTIAKTQRLAGFTLLELLIAFTIASLLLAIGAPAMGTFLRNNALQAQSFELMTVSLDEALPPIAVEVGREARAELGLQPGTSVFLIIKAMSCTLYEEMECG